MNKRVVLFYGHRKGKHVTDSCFSQFYPCEFTIDGQKYNCAEQFMMAEKARAFGDEKTRGKILASKEPAKIKALGRCVEPFDAKMWATIAENVVMVGNFAKFSQNPLLAHHLLSTENALLAEASPSDSLWGIGLSKKQAATVKHDEWPGKNLLGKSLMTVRTAIQGGVDVTTFRGAHPIAELDVEALKARNAPTELEKEAYEKLVSNDKRCSELFVETRVTLLQRVNTGDQKAFEEFYNVYCPAMLMFVGLTDDAMTEQDQWDLVQTVFAKFYKTFSMVKDPDTGERRIPRDLLSVMVRTDKKTGTQCIINFRQYLITCLKNAVTTKWRHDTHKGKSKETSMDADVDTEEKNSLKDVLVDPQPGPSARLEQKEREERDRIVLDIWPVVIRGYVMDSSLDDCVRDITYRSIAEDVPAEELAKHWGVTKNNAYQIKHRGVEKAIKITKAIYEMLVDASDDIDDDVRRLSKAVAAMKPSKHIDKFMIRLAQDILDEGKGGV